MLTRGNEAGNEVKRKRVVVGDDVSTLSDSKVVSSKAVLAVVPVLYHFVVEVDPKVAWRVGVRFLANI